MLKGLLFPSLLSLSLTSFAQDDLQTQFQNTYQDYQKAVQDRDISIRRNLAQKSYKLGCEYYGQENINCGSLALNYAYELRDNYDQINALFEQALSIYKLTYPENSVEIADIYYQQAKSNLGNDRWYVRSYAHKALDIADELYDTDPLASATIKLRIGQVLLSIPGSTSRTILKAYKEFQAELPKDDVRLIEARIWLAQYYRNQGKIKKSIEILEQNVEIFESIDGVTHPYELSSRAFLVGAYENRKNSDKATEHCVAIGKMTPWDPNQEQVPLYRVEPLYPSEAVRRNLEGWVQVEFQVDEQGFVVEPSVIASSDKKYFIQESLDAIKQWRYAPKFEGGVAVKATLYIQLDFKI
ncbi:TonB family protein [Thalassotalea mangrovi]|uniref:TonB family protein n=1 Tax=Thalassotalea mangrovi TaxID=2572245 RepID=A0A4V5NW93_9GAMM|nr:TonB family protein [Thalassotalea mangrovi]TKB45924.1 TonB family protein [Thalassotalea mangrovi]